MTCHVLFFQNPVEKFKLTWLNYFNLKNQLHEYQGTVLIPTRDLGQIQFDRVDL